MACGWDAYISSLMDVEDGHDAAIFGIEPFKLWAAHDKGNLKNVQEDQLKALMSSDTTSLCTNGLTLGSKKCTIIRNLIHNSGFADLKVKACDSCEKRAIAVAKTNKAIILLEGSHAPGSGPKMNIKASQMADYLKGCGY